MVNGLEYKVDALVVAGNIISPMQQSQVLAPLLQVTVENFLFGLLGAERHEFNSTREKVTHSNYAQEYKEEVIEIRQAWVI